MAKISAKGLSFLHQGEALIPSKVYNAMLKGASNVQFKFDKLFVHSDIFKRLPPIIFTFDGEVIFSRTKEDMMLESKKLETDLIDALHYSLSKHL